MKKLSLFCFCFCLFLASQAQVSKTVNVSTAGTLGRLLNTNEKTNTTNLTITGKIDARDFVILRDSMPNLAVIDISKVSISACVSASSTGYTTTFPANTIPEAAFYRYNDIGFGSNTTLTSIILPSTVNSIGEASFAFCKNLTSLSIGSTVTSIGNAALAGCAAFINVDVNNQKYSSLDGVLFNKKQNLLLQVPTSFSNSYTVPATVDSIGAFSFLFCDKLNAIVFPSTVSSIGDGAFFYCSASFYVNEMNMNYSGLDGVLYDKAQTQLIICPSAKSGDFIIPSSVSTIVARGFANCKKITSISLPSTIKTIGEYAFASCTGLTSITTNGLPISLSNNYKVFDSVPVSTCVLNVPYGAKSLYKQAFQWMDFTNIVENSVGFVIDKTSVTLQSKAASTATVNISSNTVWTAASNQSWLKVTPIYSSGDGIVTFTAEVNTSVDTRSAVVTISANGVNSQTISVTQAGLPKTVNIVAGGLSTALTTKELSTIFNLAITGTMDARDFKTIRDNMPQLSTLDLSTVSIAAYSGTSGTSYNTSYLANTIPDNAFYNGNSYGGNLNLSSVILPSSAIAIGDAAFENCKGIATITLPASVAKIGSYAFEYCSALTSIEVENSTPINFSSNWNVFYGINSACILNVPYGSKALYAVASQWKDFSSIVENPHGFTLGSSSVRVGASAGTSSALSILSNEAWSVSSDQTWLTLSITNGSGNKSVTFNFEANSLAVTRTATVTVSSAYAKSQVFTITQNASPKTISIVAGALKTTLTTNELSNTTDLKITGTMDARDFKTMRDNMPLLANLDLSQVTITAYSGIEGTEGTYNYTYVADGIPQYAFHSSSNYTENKTLLSVIFPSSLVFIGYDAFYYCKGLTSITIPNTVTKIDDYAFYYCTSISSIYTDKITPLVLSQYSSPFYGIDKTNCTLNVPYGTKVLYSAAYQWKEFTKIVENTHGFKPDLSVVRIKAAAGSNAIINISSAEAWSVSSDQSWLSIDKAAGFANSPITVTAQENTLFTTRIATVTVSAPGVNPQTITITQAASPKTVTVTAGALAASFATAFDLSSVSNLVVKGTIDARDFKTMRDKMLLLNDLDLSAATIVSYTGTEGTYYYSYSNTIYPANTVPESSFYNQNTSNYKTSLLTVVLPTSTTAIGSSAFKYCSGLTSIAVPNSVSSIANAAFSYCSGLTTVSFGNGLKTIGENSFEYCNSLLTLAIPNSVTTIGAYTFYNCKQLTDVKLSNSITTIEPSLFSGCEKLASVIIPEGVKSIGYSAFSGCTSLSTISIPNSVTSFGSSSFYSCPLQTIYAYPIVPIDLSSNSYFFNSTLYSTCTLYVPKGSKALYQAAYQWKDFLKIVEMTNTDVTNPKLDEIIVYPNPATSYFTVNGLEDVANVSVFNLNGKVLFSTQISNSETVAVDDLPKGFYILRINTNAGTVERKLIKK